MLAAAAHHSNKQGRDTGRYLWGWWCASDLDVLISPFGINLTLTYSDGPYDHMYICIRMHVYAPYCRMSTYSDHMIFPSPSLLPVSQSLLPLLCPTPFLSSKVCGMATTRTALKQVNIYAKDIYHIHIIKYLSCMYEYISTYVCVHIVTRTHAHSLTHTQRHMFIFTSIFIYICIH